MQQLLGLFLALGLVLNFFSFKKGFYRLPERAIDRKTPFEFLWVPFGIYLFFSLFLTPLIAKGFLHSARILATTEIAPIILISLIQLVMMLIIFAIMTLYIKKRDQLFFSWIWKDADTADSPVRHDFFLGSFTWLLSFPLMVIVNAIFDHLIQTLFHAKAYEQSAVKYVKMTLESPIALFAAVVAVILLAPLVEEFLFRGCLQTYLKNWLSPKKAIFLSGFIFTCFHLSLNQGWGNVPIFFSLLLLGLFLGFIYEKQGSLWSSIGLHMTFNGVSVFRILFFDA